MRLSSILLASIGAVLLSSEVVVATTTTKQSGVSTGISPDQVQFTQNNQADKRFLRAYHPSKEADEERLSTDKLANLMTSEPFSRKQFNKWIGKGYTDRKIHNKLGVDSNNKYSRIFHAYQNYIEKFAPHLISN